MLDVIRADLAAFEARSEKRLAVLHDRISHLALAILHLAKLGATDMSVVTTAIKADLAKLDASLDGAIAHTDGEHSDIRDHIKSIHEKVESMVPQTAPVAEYHEPEPDSHDDGA